MREAIGLIVLHGDRALSIYGGNKIRVGVVCVGDLRTVGELGAHKEPASVVVVIGCLSISVDKADGIALRVVASLITGSIGIGSGDGVSINIDAEDRLV